MFTSIDAWDDVSSTLKQITPIGYLVVDKYPQLSKPKLHEPQDPDFPPFSSRYDRDAQLRVPPPPPPTSYFGQFLDKYSSCTKSAEHISGRAYLRFIWRCFPCSTMYTLRVFTFVVFFFWPSPRDPLPPSLSFSFPLFSYPTTSILMSLFFKPLSVSHARSWMEGGTSRTALPARMTWKVCTLARWRQVESASRFSNA